MSEISDRVRIAVWNASNGLCAFPGCQRELTVMTDAGMPSLLGDVAHIIGASADGPRGASPMSAVDRNLPPNLVLLCKLHHKQVDDDPDRFTIDAMRAMKTEHEARIARLRAAAASVDRQTVTAHVTEWARRADLDGWETWSSWLLTPTPRISAERREALWDLVRWMRSRLWPEDFLPIRLAFTQFALVLASLLATFDEHADERDGELLTSRFYQIREWDPELYHRLLAEFEWHVALVHDLVLELTRAANLLCDAVREELDPQFRTTDAVLMVVRGPNEDYRDEHLRPEYVGEQRSGLGYGSLERFVVERSARDQHVGAGPPPSSDRLPTRPA